VKKYLPLSPTRLEKRKFVTFDKKRLIFVYYFIEARVALPFLLREIIYVIGVKALVNLMFLIFRFNYRTY